MGGRLGGISLYEVIADSKITDELRPKVARNLRIGTLLSIVTICLGFTLFFITKEGLFFQIPMVVFSAMGAYFCFLQGRNLSQTPGRRLISTNQRFIRDRVGLFSLGDRIIDYPYDQMLRCAILQSGLLIEMKDGGTLKIPLNAFAHRADFNSFIDALEEEKNVPVIDLTNQESSSAV